MMPLSTQQLDLATGVLTTLAPGMNPLPELRRELNGVVVTRCDADDMRGETPFRRLPGFDLFLVDTSGHCVQLVSDLNDASGIIVAAKK